MNHYCYYLAPEKPDFARLTAFWAEAATLARELGVTLALENEAHDATAHPDGTRAILDGMKLPALGTNFGELLSRQQRGLPARLSAAAG